VVVTDWGHNDQFSIQQFNAVVLFENARLRETMVFIGGEAVSGAQSHGSKVNATSANSTANSFTCCVAPPENHESKPPP